MQFQILKKNLSYLIEKYVTLDLEKRRELLALLNADPIPIKGLLADLTPLMSGCSDADSRMIKGIVFNYI